jgi:hypothetical protein
MASDDANLTSCAYMNKALEVWSGQNLTSNTPTPEGERGKLGSCWPGCMASKTAELELAATR